MPGHAAHVWFCGNPGKGTKRNSPVFAGLFLVRPHGLVPGSESRFWGILKRGKHPEEIARGHPDLVFLFFKLNFLSFYLIKTIVWGGGG